DRTRSAGSVAILADPVYEADDLRLTGSNVASQTRQSGASETNEVSSVFRDVGPAMDDGRIPRLLASREEAEAIMAVVPTRTAFKALDFDASRATLSTPGLAQYRILHFATHAM